jgi:hypothetical protein
MGLSENVFGVELERFLGAGFNAKRLTIAKVTFERMLDILVEKHGSEGTAGETLVTGNALLLIKSYYTVLLENSVCGTPFATLRHSALLANDGHTYHGMRIEDHYPHAAFFRVVDVFATDAACQFTDFAPGTTFRDNRKVHVRPPLFLGGFESEYTYQKGAWKARGW